uniref:Peptidase S1 domain-containing protein n=1 Tax=Panagrolaimus sp. ES5 TaxID=591445 RepID=A0AC34FAJ6_9BILA
MFEKDGKYYQIGITSAGANGTGIEFIFCEFLINYISFSFYTRLSDYCEWIKMITNGDASCEPLPADINRNQPLSDPDIPPFLIPANEPDVTVLPLPTAAPQSSSRFATFNILFLFFVVFLFA